MDSPGRLLAVLAVLVLAGCTTGVMEAETTQTPAPATPALDDEVSANLTLASAERVDVEVTRVVDGDTVDVRFPDGREDTVRLLGVDTPEVHVPNEPSEYEGVPDTEAGASCLREAGHDASIYVEGRIAAGNVTLVYDPSADRRGGYGRLLGYVYVGERNLNYELLASGNARVYETDFTFREAFDAAEQRARDDQRGLWQCRSGS